MADRLAGKLNNGGENSRVLTAESIAGMVGGRVVGDAAAEVRSVAPLDRAGRDDLTFLASAKYQSLFERADCGIVLMSPALAESEGSARARVIVDKPHDAMLSLLAHLYPTSVAAPGIHPTVVLERGAVLGDGVCIGANVTVGAGAVLGAGVRLHPGVHIGNGVVIGDDCELFHGVTLYPGVTLGARVRVHAGARLGSDGFGYVFRNGAHEKIPHVGRCIIESDVEIGANTTIDRGSIDDTVVGAGTRIDNLVHIAHNVRIGKLCLIMAQVGIAGSVRIGDGVILAGQVGISGHHTIGDRATLAAQAGVFGDIPAGETWSGYPARPHKEALKAQAALFRLVPMIRALERLIKG